MPLTTYKYKARTVDGALVNGVVEAYSEFEAVEQIKQTCSIVEKIAPVQPSKLGHVDLNEPLWVTDKVLSLVSSQFSIMLRAGLSMTRVVGLVAEQCSDKLMQRILRAVAGDVAAGYGLAQSFENHGKKLPTAFIETVRAGEESGTLEASFLRLKEYYERSSQVKQKVRSAMIYPVFLLALAAVVVGVVMVRLVPTMLEMFENMDSDLPLPTLILMSMSRFFQHYWPLLVAGACLIVLVGKLYAKTETGVMRMARLRLRLPVLGRIGVMQGASQFANTMSTLLASGLSATRCLSITGKVLENPAIGHSVSRTVGAVESGRSLGEVLSTNPYLPDMLLEMTAIGEESGALEETLATVGAYYDSEVEAASARALSMLEPIITIIMGLLIGFIIIAIYIPMFSMYGGVGL